MTIIFHTIPPLGQGPALKPDQAHLFTVRVDQAQALLPALHSCLSEEECHKAAAFRFQEDRDRSVVARGVLRRLLGQALDREAGEVSLQADANGKPRLGATHHDLPPIGFNVSHSGNIVLIVLALGREVGVDVEQIRPLPDLKRLVELCLSPNEARQHRSLAREQRLEAFYTCWTGKEALVKATGQGLGRDLRALDIGLDRMARPRILRLAATSGEAPQRWHLRPFVPAPGYAGACVLGPWP
ncbi:MAG: 4'-phosphopantetheinyl transferase superfamily protein [Desulfovibrionaceae bacterium]